MNWDTRCRRTAFRVACCGNQLGSLSAHSPGGFPDWMGEAVVAMLIVTLSVLQKAPSRRQAYSTHGNARNHLHSMPRGDQGRSGPSLGGFHSLQRADRARDRRPMGVPRTSSHLVNKKARCSPPCPARSPWASPSIFSLRTIRRPGTEDFQIAVRTVLAFHARSRGRPTFTESNLGIRTS